MQEQDTLNAQFNTIYPQEILYNAVQIFGHRLAVMTRFQPADMVILHMLSTVAPHVPVLALDTGLPSWERYEAVYRTINQLNINLIQIRTAAGIGQEWSSLSVPLNRTLTSYHAWIIGQHVPNATQVITRTAASNRIRIAPLAYWGQDTISAYLNEYKLPSIATHARSHRTIITRRDSAPASQPLIDSTKTTLHG